MLRSMYAGVSGIKNFQTKLDVIGNNIANVNTTGFKKGRITFQDMMSQTLSGAQASTNQKGGMNASQVGSGSQLGSIDNIHTQGFRQTTNNPLDLALEGDGMFVIASNIQPQTAMTEAELTDAELTDAELAYTRAGNFYLDENGRVVNPQGLYLMGYIVNAETGVPNNTFSTIEIPDDAQSFNIQTNGLVTYVDQNGDNHFIGMVAIANFSNPEGLVADGSNHFVESQNSGEPQFVQPETEGVASIVSGALEMSNVDLADEFTEMITAQRAFQANTRIITTSDEILQELVNLKR